MSDSVTATATATAADPVTTNTIMRSDETLMRKDNENEKGDPPYAYTNPPNI